MMYDSWKKENSTEKREIIWTLDEKDAFLSDSLLERTKTMQKINGTICLKLVSVRKCLLAAFNRLFEDPGPLGLKYSLEEIKVRTPPLELN